MKCLIYFAVVLAMINCNSLSPSMEETIASMSSDQVGVLWEDIFRLDQNHRGVNTIDSVDNSNFAKSMYLIRHHGFPNNNIANIIFSHHRAQCNKEKYIAILYNEFLKGKGDRDDFWFLHNLKNVFRGKYGRDLVRGRDLTYDDIGQFSAYLNLDKDVVFNEHQFYEQYDRYIKQTDNIISKGEVVGAWQDDGQTYTIQKYMNNLYYMVGFADGSFRAPVELVEVEGQKYVFKHPLPYSDTLRIDKKGNLILDFEGLENSSKAYAQ